jgi:hypothetical protein
MGKGVKSGHKKLRYYLHISLQMWRETTEYFRKAASVPAKT